MNLSEYISCHKQIDYYPITFISSNNKPITIYINNYSIISMIKYNYKGKYKNLPLAMWDLYKHNIILTTQYIKHL
jgi:hypothetical protein